jgi:hypothetical protein
MSFCNSPRRWRRRRRGQVGSRCCTSRELPERARDACGSRAIHFAVRSALISRLSWFSSELSWPFASACVAAIGEQARDNRGAKTSGYARNAIRIAHR